MTTKNVTLKQARRLSDRITIQINKFELEERISLFTEQDCQSILSIAKVNTTHRIQDHLNLINVRSRLRQAIQIKNQAGVNHNLSLRKKIIDEISVWQPINALVDAKRITTVEYLTNEKERQMDKSALYGRANQTLSIPALNDDIIAQAPTELKKLQHELDDIGDIIASLNAKLSISILPDDVDILKAANIL
jgi:hypothetical protein